MAGSSLLVLLDDIAAVLDDVATMTKVAARKTAGVLGDDLAVNAEKVTGVRADRELPVVWAVAKGSFKNKCILVPAALAISLVAPWLITPLLMLGGLFLCYEGFEKVAHKFLHTEEEDAAHHEDLVEHLADPAVDLVAYERDKIKGAIRTDFILSAEIIVLTLGVVANMDFTTQVLVVSGIAIIMTVGVYGLVAGIVKLDDAGLYLLQREGEGAWGRFQLVRCAPAGVRALADEGAGCGGYRGHVHGGGRYSGAWRACTRRVDKTGGRDYWRTGDGGSPAGGAHADPGGHPYRYDRRCGRVRSGQPVAAAEGSLTGIILLLLQQRAEDSAE